MSQTKTVADKKVAKKTQRIFFSFEEPTNTHIKANSKPLRLQKWLQLKLRPMDSTSTKISKAATLVSPNCCTSAPRPTDQHKILQPVLQKRDAALNASNPPAYDDQGLYPLYIGLPQEDVISIMERVDSIMEQANANYTPQVDLTILMAITTAIREGCIIAAATVCQVALEKTVTEFDNIVYEACQKVARLIITATAAAGNKGWTAVANGAACYIDAAASLHQKFAQNSAKKGPMPFAAAAQLRATVYSVAAVITSRRINHNYVLDDIPLPAWERSQPEP